MNGTESPIMGLVVLVVLFGPLVWQVLRERAARREADAEWWDRQW